MEEYVIIVTKLYVDVSFIRSYVVGKILSGRETSGLKAMEDNITTASDFANF